MHLIIKIYISQTKLSFFLLHIILKNIRVKYKKYYFNYKLLFETYKKNSFVLFALLIWYY